MDEYTKINNTSNKSRSKDFSDLQSFPQSSNNLTVFRDNIHLESISKNHDENESEEKMKGNNNIPIGVKLNRACSVSSANRLRLERQGSKRTTTSTSTSFQSVKRIFSMRRSSSVSEKYCRIHDQGFTISSPVLNEAHECMEEEEKKNRSGRILKACKRLFGI